MTPQISNLDHWHDLAVFTIVGDMLRQDIPSRDLRALADAPDVEPLIREAALKAIRAIEGAWVI